MGDWYLALVKDAADINYEPEAPAMLNVQA